MTTQDQLEREPITAAASEARAAPASTIKSILLHVQNDASLEHRMQNALSLARACGAHLSCLHVTPIEAYVAFDSFGGVFVMSDIIKALDEEEAKLRSIVEERLRGEDVSWDYEQVTGNVTSQIIGRAALADLVVTGREPHRSDFVGPAVGLLGDLLYRSRTPIFIPGAEGEPCDPTGIALIAWDGGYEAANAVRSAVGLLKLASEVRILQIEEEKEEAFPSTRLLEYLSRHEIHADLRIEPAAQAKGDPRSMAERLITRAGEYIVMGGYNHSRIGEYIFGGVTRSMLASSPVPIVIAH